MGARSTRSRAASWSAAEASKNRLKANSARAEDKSTPAAANTARPRPHAGSSCAQAVPSAEDRTPSATHHADGSKADVAGVRPNAAKSLA